MLGCCRQPRIQPRVSTKDTLKILRDGRDSPTQGDHVDRKHLFEQSHATMAHVEESEIPDSPEMDRQVSSNYDSPLMQADNDEAVDSASISDLSQHRFLPKEKVEIHSYSSQGWVEGTVSAVRPTEEGQWINVKYKDKQTGEPRRKKVLAHDTMIIRHLQTEAQRQRKDEKSRKLNKLKNFLDQKGDPNQTNKIGETKLHSAAEDGYTTVRHKFFVLRPISNFNPIFQPHVACPSFT